MKSMTVEEVQFLVEKYRLSKIQRSVRHYVYSLYSFEWHVFYNTYVEGSDIATVKTMVFVVNGKQFKPPASEYNTKTIDQLISKHTANDESSDALFDKLMTDAFNEEVQD